MNGRSNASVPMSSVQMMYPPKTMGIISIITKNGTPVKSKYGTFSQFVRMAKERIQNGQIIPVAWCPSHDGYERDSKDGNGWDDYIEDWVIYYGKSERYNGYGIEFHTVNHYKRYRGPDGHVAKSTKRYVKPTKKNDTQYPAYEYTLKKGW